MSVDRTDYLMWGAKVDPKAVDVDAFEAEINGAPERRFDLVYDGMCGEYAVAGKVIAKIDRYEGLTFYEIDPNTLGADPDIVAAVATAFPQAQRFALYLFSHFS